MSWNFHINSWCANGSETVWHKHQAEKTWPARETALRLVNFIHFTDSVGLVWTLNWNWKSAKNLHLFTAHTTIELIQLHSAEQYGGLRQTFALFNIYLRNSDVILWLWFCYEAFEEFFKMICRNGFGNHLSAHGNCHLMKYCYY